MEETESKQLPAPSLRRGRSSSAKTLEVSDLPKPSRTAGSKTDPENKPDTSQSKDRPTVKGEGKGKVDGKGKGKPETNVVDDAKKKQEKVKEKTLEKLKGDVSKADSKSISDIKEKSEGKSTSGIIKVKADSKGGSDSKTKDKDQADEVSRTLCESL